MTYTDRDRLITILSEFRDFPERTQEVFSFFEQEFKKKIKTNIINLAATNNLISYIKIYMLVNNEMPNDAIDFFLKKKVLEIRATTLDILIEDYHENIPNFELRKPDIWMIELIDSILDVFYPDRSLSSEDHFLKATATPKGTQLRTQDDLEKTNKKTIEYNQTDLEVYDKHQNKFIPDGAHTEENIIRTHLLQTLIDLFLKDTLSLFLSQQKFKQPGNQLVLNYVYFNEILSDYVKTGQSTINLLYNNIEQESRMEMQEIEQFLEISKK